MDNFGEICFVCAVCKGSLASGAWGFFCKKCDLRYEIRDGVYDFLPENLCEVKKTDAQTYSHRADDFSHAEALQMGRPHFCDPLRTFDKEKSIFLELCGGAAHHALNLMKEGFKLVESDIAEGSVRKARDFARHLGVEKNGLFCLIDAEQLPFAARSFDAIFMISALHHLPDPAKALKEIHRCLKPEGILLIGYEPNSWHYLLFSPFFNLARRMIRKKSSHPISLADDRAAGFSKRRFKKLLQESGLELLEMRAVDLSAKFYHELVVLNNRLFGRSKQPHERLHRSLQKFDQLLFKIPAVRRFPLNWDVIAKKPQDS